MCEKLSCKTRYIDMPIKLKFYIINSCFDDAARTQADQLDTNIHKQKNGASWKIFRVQKFLIDWFMSESDSAKWKGKSIISMSSKGVSNDRKIDKRRIVNKKSRLWQTDVSFISDLTSTQLINKTKEENPVKICVWRYNWQPHVRFLLTSSWWWDYEVVPHAINTQITLFLPVLWSIYSNILFYF